MFKFPFKPLQLTRQLKIWDPHTVITVGPEHKLYKMNIEKSKKHVDLEDFRQRIQPKILSLEHGDWQQPGSDDFLAPEYQKNTIYF